MKPFVRAAFLSLIVLVPGFSLGEKLVCPDVATYDKAKEVMATSSPEVKVRASSQNDSRRWLEIIRPLIQKAAKQAKMDRSKIMQEGIEKYCPAPEIYVGQIIPVEGKATGCDHKIVTRPAEEGAIWVQAVAICKYSWSCCSPEVMPAQPAGYTLEGPMNPQSSTTTLKK